MIKLMCDNETGEREIDLNGDMFTIIAEIGVCMTDVYKAIKEKHGEMIAQCVMEAFGMSIMTKTCLCDDEEKPKSKDTDMSSLFNIFRRDGDK